MVVMVILIKITVLLDAVTFKFPMLVFVLNNVLVVITVSINQFVVKIKDGTKMNALQNVII